MPHPHRWPRAAHKIAPQGALLPDTSYYRQNRTVGADGSFRAVLQDDNAHAWAEIYRDGQGWTPLEVTPGMAAEITEGELTADAAQDVPGGAEPDAPLPARQEDQPAATRQNTPLLWVLPAVLLAAALTAALLRRARRTPLQTIQAEFRALYRKMRRLGLGEGVSSDEAAFAEFLQKCCPQTDSGTIQSLLAAVQAAQFAQGACSAATAQKVRSTCRQLRRKMRRPPAP